MCSQYDILLNIQNSDSKKKTRGGNNNIEKDQQNICHTIRGKQQQPFAYMRQKRHIYKMFCFSAVWLNLREANNTNSNIHLYSHRICTQTGRKQCSQCAVSSGFEKMHQISCYTFIDAIEPYVKRWSWAAFCVFWFCVRLLWK